MSELIESISNLQMSKLSTIIFMTLLLTACADNEDQSMVKKLKDLEKQTNEKITTKTAAEIVDSVKAKHGDSVTYVSEIYVSFEKDSVKKPTK
jgi:PBP1b-binding outer membrane lipoprotein LpoB